MFKKLLTVGALATALIGGIGTASAATQFPGCPANQVPEHNGRVWTMNVVHSSDVFAGVFVRGGIEWHIKSSTTCGDRLYVAYYEGRKI
ncbi:MULTISPECIES: LCI fold-containing protein [Photorhabdus]|uniref:LCI fold domain-containing protein n=2 Tax=Photorhabdus asymbiotica TaxID=291112 RepID=C7BK53_PHOAA|nr:LCI fold-containing protein [Photorhabdus asymbiotica]RKS65823.1 antimicrobial protein lci [Photorhabdus asymbiotica]CAQ84293.1 conserved hypothetical protein [Photorhabdus asymbiotica]